MFSFPASDKFCCLPKTFANSLDPDQTQQNVRSDLDLNYLTLIVCKIFFEKVNFEKNQQMTGDVKHKHTHKLVLSWPLLDFFALSTKISCHSWPIYL